MNTPKVGTSPSSSGQKSLGLIFRRLFWIYLIGYGKAFLIIWLIFFVFNLLFSFVGKDPFDPNFELAFLALLFTGIVVFFALTLATALVFEVWKVRRKGDKEG
jgi:hypothetical protein